MIKPIYFIRFLIVKAIKFSIYMARYTVVRKQQHYQALVVVDKVKIIHTSRPVSQTRLIAPKWP